MIVTLSKQQADAAPSPTWRDEEITLACGKVMAARIYGARKRQETKPLVLHFHAGAFIAGSLECGATVAQLLADAGAIVVSIDYPLAPAHVFPEAVEMGHAALMWLCKHQTKLAGTKAPLFVAGEEAGGNLAAAVALVARDLHQPAIAGQLLLSPMLDPCLGTASLRQVRAGVAGCKWAHGWQAYLPRVCDADHPYANPGSSSRLGTTPPTLIVSAEDDPMRDDAHCYAKRLAAAGVRSVEVVLPAPSGWPGCFMNAPGPTAPWLTTVREQFHRFLAQPGISQP